MNPYVFKALLSSTLFLIAIIFPTRYWEYPKNQSDSLRNEETFDYIVIGAGSAGSVVARRLSENEKNRVLILEAGDYPSPLVDIPQTVYTIINTKEDWSYKTEKTNTSCLYLNEQSCAWPRGKVLGGSGSINAMLYIRGNKRDYDEWAELTNEDWSYDKLLPYFHKVEKYTPPESNSNYYGTEGLLTLSQYISQEPVRKIIIEGAKELNYGHENHQTDLGYFDTAMNIDDGIRANVAWKYLGPKKHSKNLVLATGAQVLKIIIDETTKEAKGVEVFINGEYKSFYAKKEVILSAGTINSPQLLMLSGVGPKNHLENHKIPVIKNLQGVGKNLMDHVALLTLLVKFNEKIGEAPQNNKIYDLYQYYRYKTGPLSQFGIANFHGFINTKNDSKYADIQYMHLLYLKNEMLVTKLNDVCNLPSDLVDEITEAVKKDHLVNFMAVLLKPKSRGMIQLRSADPFDKPMIYSGYFTDENNEDVKVMIQGIRYIEKMLTTESFKEAEADILKLTIPNCVGLEYGSDEYWECFLRNVATTSYHPVGTCKMGKDSSAVVDERLRVHGIKKLRVVDASIMPTIVSGNTHATALIIGEKGSEMILEDDLGVTMEIEKEKLQTIHDEF